MLGISVLRLTMPYHDIRMPAEISRADYAVSANIGRTLDAVRQGVVDVRCCLDWLQQQGCESWELWAPVWVHVMPSSRRRMIRAFAWLRLIMLPLMLPMWCGMDSRRGTSGREWKSQVTLETLRQSWLAVSPMAYFDKFARWPRKSLIIYAKYDLTFLPELSRNVVEEFERYGLDHKVVVAALRSLYDGRGALQLHGWIPAGFVLANGV